MDSIDIDIVGIKDAQDNNNNQGVEQDKKSILDVFPEK